MDCSGVCLNDADGDGVCDELEVQGCTAVNACNYNPLATEGDDSCDFVHVPMTKSLRTDWKLIR